MRDGLPAPRDLRASLGPSPKGDNAGGRGSGRQNVCDADRQHLSGQNGQRQRIAGRTGKAQHSDVDKTFARADDRP